MNRRKFLQMLGVAPLAGVLGFNASEEPRRRFSDRTVEQLNLDTDDLGNEMGFAAKFYSGRRVGVSIHKWETMDDREICAFIRNWANENGARLSEDKLRAAVHEWRGEEMGLADIVVYGKPTFNSVDFGVVRIGKS